MRAAIVTKNPLFTFVGRGVLIATIFRAAAALRVLRGYSGARRPDMAALDWSQCPAVESIPGKVSGAWTFRNSRTPVKLVFENLEDGMTIAEIIESYTVSLE